MPVLFEVAMSVKGSEAGDERDKRPTFCKRASWTKSLLTPETCHACYPGSERPSQQETSNVLWNLFLPDLPNVELSGKLLLLGKHFYFSGYPSITETVT